MVDRRTQQEMDALADRIRGMSVDTAAMAQEFAGTSCQLAGGAVGLAIIIGGFQDVTVDWPHEWPSDAYTADVVPMGLLGKASVSVISQTSADVTVRITAGLLVAAGTQFLVHGRS